MNTSGSLSRSHPPPSPWTTSMMSWLSWLSSECFPTPLMMLYAPSLSWTSLTSSLSSKHLETWTRHVAICLEHLQRSMQPQLPRRHHKGHLTCHPCPHHPPYPPHHPLLHRSTPHTLNPTSPLALSPSS